MTLLTRGTSENYIMVKNELSVIKKLPHEAEFVNYKEELVGIKSTRGFIQPNAQTIKFLIIGAIYAPTLIP